MALNWMARLVAFLSDAQNVESAKQIKAGLVTIWHRIRAQTTALLDVS